MLAFKQINYSDKIYAIKKGWTIRLNAMKRKSIID